MIDKCDMCGTAIEDGKCSCGTWTDHEGLKYSPFKKALEEFNKEYTEDKMLIIVF